MSITTFLDTLYASLESPQWLIGLIVIIPLMIWILRKDWIKIKEEPAAKRAKRKLRVIMFFTRVAIFGCILIALASPYVVTEKTIEGDPYVQLLIDESNSMQLFENVQMELENGLQKKINTEVKQIGAEDVSNLGDAILANLRPHGSILLYTDGNNNAGADLGDVAMFARKMNASISIVSPEVEKKDAGIVVYGPSKTLEGAENTFKVFINKVGEFGALPVKVTIDGEEVYSETTKDQIIDVSKKLDKGTHKIEARVDVIDHFADNNVYRKTVKVVPQPKILFISEKKSPLNELLKQLYEVESAAGLPSNIKDYYAIVVNDMPASVMDPTTDVLNDYIADGNGMVVIGGENSFEQGEYKDSMFETLLPVKVGAQEKEEGDVVIAIVIDISGSTGEAFGGYESTADFSKAATVGISRGLRPETRLAVVAFNNAAYLISEPSMVYEKKNLENTIARLKWGGSTSISSGLLKAVQTIADFPGSKNIILLSDGKASGAGGEIAAIEAARYAANLGMKIYTVGVGPSTKETFMMDVAEITNGIYFRATEESKLNIIFGPVDEQQDQSSTMDLTVLNGNHFITAGLDMDMPTIYGFNQAVPKGAGRLLVTTTTAEPILTVWRLGLGRVAALATDDGGQWASTLLGKNSKLMTRIMNYAIGDPERKSQSFIDAKDTRLGEPTEITVKSSTMPSAEGVTFYKVDEDLFVGNVIPDTEGFMNVAGATFAVNYPLEYEGLGESDELWTIAQATGGKIFKKDQIDEMVEFAETKATRTITGRYYYRWPFIALAIIVFLLEIFIRRLLRKE